MKDSRPPRRHFFTQLTAMLALLIPHPSVSAPSRRSVPFGKRYVTGADSDNLSCLVDIGEIPASARWRTATSAGYDFWVVPGLPAPLDERNNPAEDWKPVNRAPRGGIIGRLITWAPGFEYPMHTTPTLDFIVVVSGRLELRLQKETQVLGPGDVLVQRATAHSWRNPGPEPCTFVGVMIDAAQQ